MDVKIETSWKEKLLEEFEKPYFADLITFVKKEYAEQRIYPSGGLIFHAFDKCPLERLKVVILGQDPYHGPNQAHGLSFSVRNGIQMPPSLLNIFKEISQDLGKDIPSNGNLERWAEQGVMLLNASLTVRAGQAGSHQGKGWELFTDRIIEVISEEKDHVVFLLWGAFAGKKAVLIDQQKHLVLKAPHPSPLSAHRGFLGSRHFSKANAWLTAKGLTPVDW